MAASSSSTNTNLEIINVWDLTFETDFQEFLRDVRNNDVISFDTEFAGILYNMRFYKKDEVYAQMKRNIDVTKCIQVGFALSKEDGSLHCNEDEIPRVWNFNLQFDRETDLYSDDAMELLTARGGLNLDKHAKHGIPAQKFGEAMLNSDLLLTGPLSIYRKIWVTYSGNYDLGHSVKIFQPANVLPDNRLVLGDMINSYFGERVFDVKIMLAYGNLAYGNMKLEEIARRFGVAHIGEAHEAGPDALVTLKLYHIMRMMDDKIGCVNMISDLFYGVNDKFPTYL